MLGAIAGDVIGSVYEANPIKTTEFPLFSRSSQFTDDSVLTIAVADTLLHGGSYIQKFKDYFNWYPYAGYGGHFAAWAGDPYRFEPYNSWGNGAAMRVSPVGFAFNDLETVLAEAKKTAEVTHNHPEGIKGAQITAATIFLARQGESKDAIKTYLQSHYAFEYSLTLTLDEIRPHYHFDVSCQGTVPIALLSLFESNDFEEAIRLAISMGGDSDTLACITGGMAQAFYGKVPDSIAPEVLTRLDEQLRKIVIAFNQKFLVNE
jgi:ADP-ribosylglycohydrolase